MREVTEWFVRLGPWVILGVDAVVWKVFGSADTITGVVRSWYASDPWVELVYLAGCYLLWLHLFRGWPERWLGGL